MYNMFETQNMEAGDLPRYSKAAIDMMHLRSSIDLCMEELPNLLDLGHVPDMMSKDYSFLYHRPSIISLASAGSSDMPETIGYCLLQVGVYLLKLRSQSTFRFTVFQEEKSTEKWRLVPSPHIQHVSVHDLDI